MIEHVVEPIVDRAVEKTAEALVQNFSERAVYSAGTVGIIAVAGVMCWGLVSIVRAAKKAMSNIEADVKATTETQTPGTVS